MKITLPYFRSLVATSALVCSLSTAISARLVAQAAVASSSIDGAVINAATKIRLRGATSDIPALGRQALSDDYGRFLFVDLPAGEHTLVTSYLGLQPERATVAVGPGQRATRDFELTADIY